jgi:hypothetical protein
MWFFLQETQSNEILITAKKPLNKLKLRHSNKILTTATKHLTKKFKARVWQHCTEVQFNKSKNARNI